VKEISLEAKSGIIAIAELYIKSHQENQTLPP
jgi:hypothetical protein